jgi:hypothetical protein
MTNRKHYNPAAAAVVGAGAGAAASFAMDLYWKLVQSTMGERPEQKPRPGGGQREDKPSTQVIADKVSEALTGREIPQENKAEAGVAVHYIAGTLCGAAYGVAASRIPRLGLLGGMLYGAAIWLLLDEIGLRLLKVSPSAEKVPTSQHLQALGAHLIYGAVTALATRLVVR